MKASLDHGLLSPPATPAEAGTPWRCGRHPQRGGPPGPLQWVTSSATCASTTALSSRTHGSTGGSSSTEAARRPAATRGAASKTSTEDRSGGGIHLTREIFKLSEALSIASKGLLSKVSEKSSKERRPQALIRLVMGRLVSSFCTISCPVLHAAARVVQEMGKSRSTTYYLGAYDEGANLQAYSDNIES